MGTWTTLPQQMVYGLALGSVYSMLALGYSMVYGVLEFINFSHGDVFMVGAFVALIMLHVGASLGLAWPLLLIAMLVVPMIACGLLGVVIERAAYRPLRSSSRLAPLISAIGVSLILENLVMLAQIHFQGDARPQTVPATRALPGADGSWNIGGIQFGHTAVLMFVVSMILMLGLSAIVSRSSMGRSMRATAQDGEVAGLMGIDVSRVVAQTFFLGSALAGAAGCLVALYYTQIDYTMGYSAGIEAFTAAVLGGIGSIRGAMAGGLLLGLVDALAATLISSAYVDLISFAILVAILALRPSGLFGYKALERV